MVIEKQETDESQQCGLTVTPKQPSSHSKKTDPLPTYNSLSSPSPTNVINIDDDDKVLKSKEEQRLGILRDNVEIVNELSSVVKGSPNSRPQGSSESTKREKNEDENVGETSSRSSSSNKGNQHLTLEELGVTVEDLKSMPWEAFDPTWEIRSEAMDPWLGGYIKDITSTHDH